MRCSSTPASRRAVIQRGERELRLRGVTAEALLLGLQFRDRQVCERALLRQGRVVDQWRDSRDAIGKPRGAQLKVSVTAAPRGSVKNTLRRSVSGASRSASTR